MRQHGYHSIYIQKTIGTPKRYAQGDYYKFRIFERKFTAKRGCTTNCPVQISQKLPKASLDHVFLYDSLLLLGQAVEPVGQVKINSVQCRKRNGKSGIWAQGGALLRNIRNWNQTNGITGSVRTKSRRNISETSPRIFKEPYSSE